MVLILGVYNFDNIHVLSIFAEDILVVLKISYNAFLLHVIFHGGFDIIFSYNKRGLVWKEKLF